MQYYSFIYFYISVLLNDSNIPNSLNISRVHSKVTNSSLLYKNELIQAIQVKYE